LAGPLGAGTLASSDVPLADTLRADTPLVVVIEDDPGSQKTLARVLRTGGFAAAIYASAEEFVASPPQSDAIALLLDIHLGGMSGLDLQRWLRARGSTLPVIVITAYDDARSREQAERLGCVAFLRKPCEAEAILTLLRGLPHDERR
jgi:FixJ family two-component response regulator